MLAFTQPFIQRLYPIYKDSMRVLIVNTSDGTGGAAVASSRLAEALINNGVSAKMLVMEKSGDKVYVASVGGRLKKSWCFLYERFVIWMNNLFSRKNLFAVSTANAGIDILHTKEFREADLIHLHWINQGMLSLRGIRNILQSGKPVVWTMHDMWPATAICHYAHDCVAFQSSCHNCPQLRGGGSEKDLSYSVWNKKKSVFSGMTIRFVACSHWLESEARKSALLAGQSITSIPNAIDTRVFRPGDKRQARLAVGLPEDKNIILFVSQKVTDERKGMNFFVKALYMMVEKEPSLKNSTCVAVLGGRSEEMEENLPFDVHSLGYVSEPKKIVDVYNSADVFVLPSLEDNLPNTIMEAMACGVPCVGFKVGGLPEMIDHRKNGYVAAYKSVADLSEGIRWVLCEADRSELSTGALRKVSLCYSQSRVAMKYIEVYSQEIASIRHKYGKVLDNNSYLQC